MWEWTGRCSVGWPARTNLRRKMDEGAEGVRCQCLDKHLPFCDTCVLILRPSTSDCNGGASQFVVVVEEGLIIIMRHELVRDSITLVSHSGGCKKDAWMLSEEHQLWPITRVNLGLICSIRWCKTCSIRRGNINGRLSPAKRLILWRFSPNNPISIYLS